MTLKELIEEISKILSDLISRKFDGTLNVSIQFNRGGIRLVNIAEERNLKVDNNK